MHITSITTIAVAILVVAATTAAIVANAATFSEPASRGQFCDHDKVKDNYFNSRYTVSHSHDSGTTPISIAYHSFFHTACASGVDPSTCGKCAGIGELAPTFVDSSEKIKCNASDLLTTKKELYILDLVIKATADLSLYLRGPSWSGGLKPSSSTSQKCGNQPGVLMPASHSSALSGGEHFMLYLTSGPDSPILNEKRNRTSLSGVKFPPPLAWGAACGYNSGDDRPITGHLHFTPAGITSDDPDATYSDSKKLKDKFFVMHQILHILGFSTPFFRPGGYSTSGTYLGSRVTYPGGQFVSSTTYVPEIRRRVFTTNVRSQTRTFFSCTTAGGAESHEASSDSHWVKRHFADDVMSEPLPWDPVPYMSKVTLGYFQDSTYWSPDYSAVTAESSYGRGRGCNFLNRDCRSAVTSSSTTHSDWREHCWDAKHEQCSGDLLSGGPCNLVNYKQCVPSSTLSYFGKDDCQLGGPEINDFCPVPSRITSFTQCNDMSNSLSVEATKVRGNVYSTTDSRCITATINKMGESPLTPYQEARCTTMICAKDSSGNNALFLEMFNGSFTIKCPIAGGAVNVALYSTEYAGEVFCPPYSICTEQSSSLITTTGSTKSESSPSVTATGYSTAEICEQRLVCANTAKAQFQSDSKCTQLSRSVSNCFLGRCASEQATFVRGLALGQNCSAAGFKAFATEKCADGLQGAIDLCGLVLSAAGVGALLLRGGAAVMGLAMSVVTMALVF